MSVRRGHISEEKEASERREWYLQLQGRIFDSRSIEALAPINSLAQTLSAQKCSFHHSINNLINLFINHSGSKDLEKSPQNESAEDTISRSGKLPVQEEESIRPQKLFPPIFWTDWLVKLNKAKDSSTTVFVCFHGVGSSPACFKRLSSYLDLDALFYGVCLPGRQNHEVLEPSTGAMTTQHCSEAIFTSLVKSGLIGRGQGRRRLVLIGHCLGACLAFEVGRLLQANGYTACLSALCVASACSPEALSRTNQLRRPPDPRQPSRRKLAELGLPLPADAPPEMRSMARDDDLLDHLLSEMRAVSPPQMLDRRHDLLKLLLPTFRRDFALLETYRLGNPLLDDGEVSLQGLRLEDEGGEEGDGDEGRAAWDRDRDREGEGEKVWTIRKAIFTKVSAPVFLLCAGDDAAVREQEAAGWLQTSSVGAERVDLPCGGGRGALFAQSNCSVVAELLLRLGSTQ